MDIKVTQLLSKTQLLIAISIAILVGIIAVLFGGSIDVKYLVYALFIICLLSVIVLGILFSLKTHGYLDILSPYIFFPMMYLVIYGVGPHKAISINEELGVYVLILIAGGFGAFLIGSLFASSILLKENSKTKRGPKINSPSFEHKLKSMFKYSTFIGIIALCIFFVNAQGIPLLMSDLENSRVDALSGNGIPYYLSMFIMIAVWLYFLREKPGKLKFIVLLIGVGLLLLTGWRNTAVALLLVAVLIYHYQKPIPFRRLILTGILLIIIITITGLFRIYSSDLQTYELMQLMMQGNYVQAFFQYLYNYPVVFTDNLILVLQGFQNSNQYLLGASFFWNFGLIIPGIEVEAFDFYLKDYLRVGFAGGGLPPTLIGDFYLNFGTIGVFLGMLLMGIFWKLVHHIFMLNKKNLIGIGSVIILYYLSVSVRGGIENITLTTSWLLIALTTLHILTKVRFMIKSTN